MTDVKFNFETELQEKVVGMSAAELLMLGFATGRTPNNYHELFELLLDRKLTSDEECFLENLEGDQYLRVEQYLGPLVEAEVA